MQAVFAVHFWELDHQMLSFKVLAGRTTASDAKLFAIRLLSYIRVNTRELNKEPFTK